MIIQKNEDKKELRLEWKFDQGIKNEIFILVLQKINIEKTEDFEFVLNDLDKKYFKNIQELQKKNYELSNRVANLENEIEYLKKENINLKNQILKNKTTFNLSRSQEIKSFDTTSGIYWVVY